MCTVFFCKQCTTWALRRILELLRLTDPNRPPAPLPQAATNTAFKGGDDDAREEQVSLQVIEELEDRVAEAEVSGLRRFARRATQGSVVFLHLF